MPLRPAHAVSQLSSVKDSRPSGFRYNHVRMFSFTTGHSLSRSAYQAVSRFQFEGIFIKHMFIQGTETEDTAWYALLDSEWPVVKENMRTWLYRNPDGRLSLTELNCETA